MKLLPLLLLLALPGAVQAQWYYVPPCWYCESDTINTQVTIGGYTGPGGALIIPDTIKGLPVTIIDDSQAQTYGFCPPFSSCTNLTSVTIPNSVTRIGGFYGCTKLANVTIGSGVKSIDGFDDCTNLTGVYFQGNAPTGDSSVFDGDSFVTVYYLLGTTGWGTTFADRPTALWNPQVQTGDASFGVRTNRFGFTLTGTSNLVVVVEASTSLEYPKWVPVGTNTLTGGSSYFSDLRWTNLPARFYRLRSP